MENLSFSAILVVLGMAVGSNAPAQNLSPDDYKLQGKTIDAQFKSDKEACFTLSGNAKDVCVEKAKTRRKSAEADLEARYKPTAKNRYEAAVTKAEGSYNVAAEMCDDKAGNAKDVCVKEAKAAKEHAIADAKAGLEDTKANAVAAGKSADAHRDAAADKADADFAVAKEKCETFAGSAKDQCLSDARARYGKR